MWQDELLWYEKAVLWILRQGDVPSHVAIMPDGNRRFSRRTGTELRQTYVAGTLLYCRACLWCFRIGVESVTTFLLATRHIRRCEYEIAALLSGVIDTLAESLHNLDLSADLIDKYLAEVECPDVNMLMRCAGPRFSDFAVPQCSYAYLNMVPKLWEELGFWDWIWAFVKYQLSWPPIKDVKRRHDEYATTSPCRQEPFQVIRQRNFLMRMQSSRMQSTRALSKENVNPEARRQSSTTTLGP
ncbi:hypothetical protein MTO96_017779 [Rhipicephalus appendiculatus]